MIEDIPEETLRAELHALDGQLATLRGTKRRFKEDAHETLDLSVKVARERVDTLLREGVYRLSRSVGQAVLIPGLADAMALADPAIVKRWHHLIDATPGSNSPDATFGPFTRAEYQAQRTTLEGEIRTRARELARRIEARRHEAETARLEEAPEAALDAAERALEPGEAGYGAMVHVHNARQTEEVTHA